MTAFRSAIRTRRPRAQRPVCDCRGVERFLWPALQPHGEGAVAADVDEWWSVAWAQGSLRTLLADAFDRHIRS